MTISEYFIKDANVKNNIKIKTLSWPQIINDFLKENGFDCLKNGSKKCYCRIDNLFNCSFDAYTFDCNPGNIRELENYFVERTYE
jgi:hypothetical protein